MGCVKEQEQFLRGSTYLNLSNMQNLILNGLTWKACAGR